MRPPSIFDDLDHVPAIALDPRFAGLIRLAALGYPGKRVESRSWATHYRGPLVVCSTTGRGTAEDPDLAEAFAAARAELVPAFVEAELFDAETSRTCAAAALVTVAGGERNLVPADWPRAWYPKPGRACVGNGRILRAWDLGNLWPLDPFPVRSSPGFFRVPARDVACALIEAVPEGFPAAEVIAADLPGLGARWGA